MGGNWAGGCIDSSLDGIMRQDTSNSGAAGQGEERLESEKLDDENLMKRKPLRAKLGTV